MSKQWHFFDKTYRVWLVVTVSDADEFRKFLKDCTYTQDFEDGNAGALIHLCKENTTNGNDCYVLWMRQWETGCFVHELTHLVMMVFDAKGIPVSIDNTEGYAYYVEYWFNEITRARRRLPDGRTPAEAKRNK